MILTEDIIKNLPLITEEELKELDSMDDNYILESFNERCDIIKIKYKDDTRKLLANNIRYFRLKRNWLTNPMTF